MNQIVTANKSSNVPSPCNPVFEKLSHLPIFRRTSLKYKHQNQSTLPSENTYGKYMHKHFKNFLNISIYRVFRSSHLEVFYKATALKILIKLIGKHLLENMRTPAEESCAGVFQ